MAQPALVDIAGPGSGAGKRIERFSTLSQPPVDRFAYWCALHPRTPLELPDPAQAATFRAEMLLHVDAEGVAYSDYSSDAATARFGQVGADFIMVAAHWGGATTVRSGSGLTLTVLPESGL